MKNIIIFFLLSTALFTAVNCTQPNSNEGSPKTDTVIISGMKFNPETLTVNRNDTIIWINQDLVAHNVAAFPDTVWKSDTIGLNGSWKKVATEDLNYFCTIHPVMKGKIVIK